MTMSQISSPSTICIARWNVAGAPHKPNGIRTNWNSLNLVMKAVSCLSSSAIGICQYLEFMSKVQNLCFPAKLSRHSSIKGRGYASFAQTLLTALKSIQYLQDPSFFRTSSGGDAHSEWLCSMTPAANICSKVAFFCFSNPRGDRRIDCLIVKACPVFK